MKTYCDEVRLPPILTNNNTIELIPKIELPGQQLDMLALSYVQRVYRHIDKNPVINTNKKSNISLNIVKNIMPKIYESCGVTEFRGSKIPDIPFSIIPAKQDKHYQFYPNDHEDCEYRGKCGTLGCSIKQKRDQVCPYYGVYVVCSSIPEDINATLCGTIEDHTYYNLNAGNGVHSKNYWFNKITEHMDKKIVNAVSSGRDILVEVALREKHRIIMLYEQMTRFLDEDMPISEQILIDNPLPEISLRQILEIFKTGLGYDEIIIIDPSCDTCIYKGRFKVLSNKFLRISRQNRQNRQTFGGRKGRRKHKSGGSKKLRKRKTYKKRKHI